MSALIVGEPRQVHRPTQAELLQGAKVAALNARIAVKRAELHRLLQELDALTGEPKQWVRVTETPKGTMLERMFAGARS